MHTVPWLISLTTAVWFGVLARRVRHNWLLWAAGGALFGLVSTTMIEGIGEAAFVPVSHEAVVLFRVKVAAMDLCSVGFLGWLFTFDLRRRHLALWKRKGHGDPPEKGKNLKSTLQQPVQPECGPEHVPAASGKMNPTSRSARMVFWVKSVATFQNCHVADRFRSSPTGPI
jgi:hypothetical protein